MRYLLFPVLRVIPRIEKAPEFTTRFAFPQCSIADIASTFTKTSPQFGRIGIIRRLRRLYFRSRFRHC